MSEQPSKRVEVVFALPGRCWRENVSVPVDADAQAVAEASGLAMVCREATGRGPAAYGVYGRKINAADVVGDGQRLELYRPLTVDPRERRRRRTEKT
ncbi:RnfH family protein [Salinisphaera hydrothermalis]|uniref:UPF0125 protein C41B8_12195 n=1 Tax=Salinisphaera hydrothermalis (strain C41B8) TaxID=1304275 RepID=A0A084IJR9_SALHC|nr:hypothetical protein C41B8_12195 [Salinisphaera hydrothermalis C41B8]